MAVKTKSGIMVKKSSACFSSHHERCKEAGCECQCHTIGFQKKQRAHGFLEEDLMCPVPGCDKNCGRTPGAHGLLKIHMKYIHPGVKL